MRKWLLVAGVLAVLALIPAAALADGPARGYGYYPELWGPLTQGRVAKVLGLTRTQLLERLGEGATLKELAEEKGVSPETLVNTILAPQKDYLDLQVKYGYLTRTQAQETLADLRLRAQDLVETSFLSPGGFLGPRGGAPYPYGPGAWEDWSGHCPMMGGSGMMGPGGFRGGWYNRDSQRIAPYSPPRSQPPSRGWGGGMMGGGMMGW